MRLKNGYPIFFRIGGRKVKIPVNPEELEVKYPTDHKTYDVLGVGEIVVPRKPALKLVSWEGFFPKNLNCLYVNSGAKSPGFYVNCFKKVMEEKQVCRLIITRPGSFSTNMSCIISNFETKDKGGEPGDIYYTIELQEYKSYAPDVITIITPPAAPESEAGSEAAGAVAEIEIPRPIETPVMRVGASVIVNGIYCNDSYGSKPHGTANNLTTVVQRIVSGNPYPILVGHYGWVQESQLQIVG